MSRLARLVVQARWHHGEALAAGEPRTPRIRARRFSPGRPRRGLETTIVKLKTKLIHLLGGVTREERAATVSEWVAHTCIREPGAAFPVRAAYAALRRYQAERMLPLPSRREFAEATVALGLRDRDGEPLHGVRPKDPAVLQVAPADSIANFLEKHASEDAGAACDVRLAWAAYARSVAPLQPAPRFEEVLQARFARSGCVVRGLAVS